MRMRVPTFVLLIVCAAAPAAFAQRFAFNRTLQVSESTRLDVSTIRGKIEVLAGTAGRVVVEGEAIVRVGFDVPANAVDLARQVAAAPPIEQTATVVRLGIPTDRATQRGVTIVYRVRVPPDMSVQATSSSGETTIDGVGGALEVHTQSGAISVRNVRGAAHVSSGSGAISADRVVGALTVQTESSSFNGTALGASLHVRTQSGAVDAALTGSGDVDVETGSSAITLQGVAGGLSAKTQSGKITVRGTPRRNWTATTSSSSVNLDVEPETGFSVDAVSRSGSVAVDGGTVQGSVTKRSVKGTIGGGGPTLRLNTGSGSIRVQVMQRSS